MSVIGLTGLIILCSLRRNVSFFHLQHVTPGSTRRAILRLGRRPRLSFLPRDLSLCCHLCCLAHLCPFAGSSHSGEIFRTAPLFTDNILPSLSQVAAPCQSRLSRRRRHPASCLSSVCSHPYFIAPAPLRMFFLRTPRNGVFSKPGGHVASGLHLPAPSAFNHFLKHFLLSASLTPLPGFLSTLLTSPPLSL